MTQHSRRLDNRNIPLMTGQGAFSVMAWSMASPPIVLTFLAVSLDLPIFLAGMLVSVRHAAGTLADLITPGAISAAPRKKHLLARLDLLIAASFAIVILAALYGSQPVVIAAFVGGILLIGFLEEIKSLMILEFLGQNFRSEDRMKLSYSQKAIGGGATIAVAVGLHLLLQDAPALKRHSLVVAIGALCFVLSAILVMSLHETEAPQKERPAPDRARSTAAFWRDALTLLKERWFRHYILVRLAFVLSGLSVPFFALIAAESHHPSAGSLTALIVSSAAALLVAAPVWRALNGYSTRAVMVSGAAMIAVAGLSLIALHAQGLDHRIHLHAASIFVATVATTGLGSARTLYFMDIAPQDQRIAAQVVSKSIVRLAIVLFSAALAGIAHAFGATWSVVAISASSILAVFVILSLVPAGRVAAT